ncbi:hypothetical protein FGO68_gene2941 [Halteria grandinella]|uniref:Uncharacterized protein n=1 Tax=Halteria grandinella TaxID=5974 RepID=A0A8J8NPD2_HALGN|nr:hypothetical protein FGO68_gene2941 [Halteria grandinella]
MELEIVSILIVISLQTQSSHFLSLGFLHIQASSQQSNALWITSTMLVTVQSGKNIICKIRILLSPFNIQSFDLRYWSNLGTSGNNSQTTNKAMTTFTTRLHALSMVLRYQY